MILKFLTNLIPPQYKAVAYLIALAVALGAFGWWSYHWYNKGVHAERTKWELAEAKIKEDSYKKGVASVKINEVIVTVYKDREIKIIKEVVKYVDRAEKVIPNNVNVYLPAGFVWVLDEAVRSEFSKTASVTDGEPPATFPDGYASIKVRDAAVNVLQNYAVCYQNANQLESLQRWITENDKIYTVETKKPFWKK